MAVPGVPQRLDQVPEVVLTPQEPRPGEDLYVGLLDQVLRQLSGAAHRAGRPEQPVDVVPSGPGIQPALPPFHGDRGQNGTAPSPFQDASLSNSRSPTPDPLSTQVLPSRHQVTARPPRSPKTWRLTPFRLVVVASLGAAIPRPETTVYARCLPSCT